MLNNGFNCYFYGHDCGNAPKICTRSQSTEAAKCFPSQGHKIYLKHVTIKEIADRLLLSTSTVSRALVGDKNIRRETKEKVLEMANRLGYRTNTMARDLKSGRTNTIGVLVPEMVTPYASTLIDGIKKTLFKMNMRVVVADSHEQASQEADNLDLMERFRVDGIIISVTDSKANRSRLEDLMARGTPIVFIDRVPHGMEVSQVIVDDYMKSYFLIERILRSGRRDVAYLKGPDTVFNSRERERGYRDAMRRFGIEVTERHVVDCGITYDDGRRAARSLLESGIHCDTIFAFTDIVAIGAMNQLRDMGIKIPEEIAVASFSGTILSEMSYPRLTTVEPPLEKMGAEAARLLLEKIDNPDSPCKKEVLEAMIRMRPSTGHYD